MIVSINQPAYLPWLGYFDRIVQSDIHIVLDNVQIERNTSTSFTNRNKIRTSQGWSWLTVPISRGHTSNDEIINNVKINGEHWKRKHLNSLILSYNRSPYFEKHKIWFEKFYYQSWSHLNQLLKQSTTYLLKSLCIETPLYYSSEMNVNGQKSDLILNYCKAVSATTYLSGPFGRDYLDATSFNEAGIEIKYHEYSHPEYVQNHGEFMPYISIVDLIFNHGPDSLNILKNN